MMKIELSEIFYSNSKAEVFSCNSVTRHISQMPGYCFVVDKFKQVNAGFVRISGDQSVELLLPGDIEFKQYKSGGFLGISHADKESSLWIPCEPLLRETNSQNQILSETPVDLSGFGVVEDAKLSITIDIPVGTVLDIVLWWIRDSTLLDEIKVLSTIESQGYFLWGSHGNYKKPSDLYRHLIQGDVYDLRYAWPHNKKVFSENEAHALYTVFAGLEKATEKNIYRYFQLQVLIGVVLRQAGDGGWYHGMWTDEKESHYRLHVSALHMLMDEYARDYGCRIGEVLQKGIKYLAEKADRLDTGVWFLHDSLELSEVAMNRGPFGWIPDTTLGKAKSNMLVLNTHLDTTVAMNRYIQLTGDETYRPLVQSALESTRAVLSMQPAEYLYRIVFWAIGLTMLPTDKAIQLSVPVRAVKRFAWKYLIKKLPDIKRRYPRLVMPNGYIDRELSLRTWAIDYQTINLMDLSRYAFAFDHEYDESILEKALAFTQSSGLIQRYRELNPGKRYSVGFWMEALYYRCLKLPDLKYRQWLAEAVLEAMDLDFGLAPSLLGCNSEAVSDENKVACPFCDDANLHVINLSYGRNVEYLVVNSSGIDRQVKWLKVPNDEVVWVDSSGSLLSKHELTVDARQWIISKLTTGV